MQITELLVILGIILFGVVLSIAMRHARQPIVALSSRQPPGRVLEGLRDALARHGCAIEEGSGLEGSITIRAKIKCLDWGLYRVWADQVTITVSGDSRGGSRLVATGRPAPLLPHAARSDPLFLDKDRLRRILIQASAGD